MTSRSNWGFLQRGGPPARLTAGVWNAVVIWRELQAKGYAGGISILRDYLRPTRGLRPGRATVRFETDPGRQLQSDWATQRTLIAGQATAVHFVVNTLSFSRRFHFWGAETEDAEHTYERDLPAAVRCFLDDFDACIAHLRFPLQHRKVIRTTNLLERLFGETRRRTKVVPHAFGERPVLKLLYAAVIRAAERWRGLAVGEFERRQLKAIRDELDRAHAARTAPAVRPVPSASPIKLSSKART